MSELRTYHCRKCGVEVLAGPYSAPELCSGCQLAANAEDARVKADQFCHPDTTVELRAEIERLRAYTAAYDKLLAERVEIECLRGLAIRAWHSFRSGLTAGGGCDCGLTDADILELVRLANEHPPA